MLEQVEKAAERRNVFASDIIREYVKKGLSVTGYEDNIEFLLNLIRQAVHAEIGRQADRLAAMLFKTGIISSSNYFLAVRMLSDVINPSMQDDFKDINSNARKLGIDYMKQNGMSAVEFLQDEEAVTSAVDKLKSNEFD